MIYTSVSKSFSYHRPLTKSQNGVNSLTLTGTFCVTIRFEMFTNTKHTETVKIVIKQGRIQVLRDLKLTQFLESPLRKRIQHYEYKMRYENENLFRKRKEINFKFKKSDKYHKCQKIQKNILMLLLINCLTHLNNTFFPPTFLGAFSLIVSLYDNNFEMSFCIDGIER